MDEKSDVDKVDDVMLHGFRFHPTDRELVGFYLKKKIQQKPLPINSLSKSTFINMNPETFQLSFIFCLASKENHFPFLLLMEYYYLMFYRGRAAKGMKSDAMRLE
ncbi:hypothetical protein V6N13_123667 [Hibiscus sabdariffa]|uniref:NAC domain-containing protein n=1 Tax=Hibiscus sabdariffa TaxID=183260 RepID=A0ABR2QU48_9ROSI